MVAVSTNPKKAFGTKKPGVHFIPPVAILEEAVVMALGAAKYGPFNWVEDPVDATTYIDAIDRHLKQWQTGEDADAESGASHLAHIRACCAILLDAQAIGNLIDDRSKGTASATAAIDRLKKETKSVERSKFKVGDKVRTIAYPSYVDPNGCDVIRDVCLDGTFRLTYESGYEGFRRWDVDELVSFK